MPRRLAADDLLQVIIEALVGLDCNPVVLAAEKPFLISLRDPETDVVSCVKIYIWNCTHGGGAARPSDEFRIQLTGARPQQLEPGVTTLMLGWYAPNSLFVAFDVNRHIAQNAQSPSAQVRSSIFAAANINSFATGLRSNGEQVVAFKPEFLLTYIRNCNTLHDRGG